jgi:hypothetical protein
LTRLGRATILFGFHNKFTQKHTSLYKFQNRYLGS